MCNFIAILKYFDVSVYYYILRKRRLIVKGDQPIKYVISESKHKYFNTAIAKIMQVNESNISRNHMAYQRIITSVCSSRHTYYSACVISYKGMSIFH